MIRITGGSLKGRTVRTPPDSHTRPTQAKLRQALFNSIQFELQDAKALDLFAGSGSLGFEAVSRGASLAVFVEKAASACKLIEKSARELKVESRIEIIHAPIESAFASPKLAAHFPFDLIFADPPYEQGFELKLLNGFPWAEGLASSGKLLLESSSHDEALPDSIQTLTKSREKKYGDTLLTTFKIASS